MAAGAIIAAVGVGVSIYGQINQAQQQAAAAQREAANREAMAQETYARAALNKQSLGYQMNEQVGNQKSSYAAGNVDIGSGSPLVTMENTLAMGRRKMFMDQEQANFEAQQDLIGAGNDRTLADQTMQAGYINSAGTLLTGAGSFAKNYSGNAGNNANGVNQGNMDQTTADNGGIQNPGTSWRTA